MTAAAVNPRHVFHNNNSNSNSSNSDNDNDNNPMLSDGRADIVEGREGSVSEQQALIELGLKQAFLAADIDIDQSGFMSFSEVSLFIYIYRESNLNISDYLFNCVYN